MKKDPFIGMLVSLHHSTITSAEIENALFRGGILAAVLPKTSTEWMPSTEPYTDDGF